jgi:hypothetical protein
MPFVFLLLILFTSMTIVPTIFAGEDDDEEEERLESQVREEEQREEEEEEENEDEGGIPLGTDTGNIILYGTIAAIVASIGYTAFKIISSKRKPRPSLK